MTQHTDWETCDWIGVDLGACPPRAWAMAADGGVRGDHVLPAGTQVETLGMALPAIDGPVLVTGAADVPTTAVPCTIPKPAPVAGRKMDLHLLSGIRQARPADLMQADATRIAGFLAKDPEFDGILCQPGRATTWSHISAEEVVSFRSFLTGELLDTLDGTVGNGLENGFDADAFQAGLGDIMSRPADLSAALSSLRADALLNAVAPDVTRARLAALLIGAELSAARPYWLGQEVVLLCKPDTALARAYDLALTAQGAMLRQADAGTALLAGLHKGYRDIVSDRAS